MKETKLLIFVVTQHRGEYLFYVAGLVVETSGNQPIDLVDCTSFPDFATETVTSAQDQLGGKTMGTAFSLNPLHTGNYRLRSMLSIKTDGGEVIYPTGEVILYPLITGDKHSYHDPAEQITTALDLLATQAKDRHGDFALLDVIIALEPIPG